MREILKSLGKRKLANILLLVQIILSLFYFFNTAVSIQKVFYIYQEVPKTLNTDTEQIIIVDVDVDSGGGLTNELFQAFCETVKKETDVEKISTYHNSWLECEQLDIEFADALAVDWDIDWIRQIEVEEGRGFREEDYDLSRTDGTKERPFPLLIGQEFRQQYSLQIGDRFEDGNNDNFIIVGVLKKSSLWFQQSISDGMFLTLDNQAVKPLSKSPEPEMNYYFKVSDHVSAGDTAEKIENIAGRYQIVLSAEVVSDRLDEQFSEEMRKNIQWLCFSLIVLVMIAVGMAAIILARMYSRRQEIGIRMAVGYSFGKICRLFVGEVLVLVLSGWIFTVIGAKIIYGGSVESFGSIRIYTGLYLSLRIILLGGAAAILMCMPTVIALFVKFRKLQPNNLIGGNE